MEEVEEEESDSFFHKLGVSIETSKTGKKAVLEIFEREEWLEFLHMTDVRLA